MYWHDQALFLKDYSGYNMEKHCRRVEVGEDTAESLHTSQLLLDVRGERGRAEHKDRHSDAGWNSSSAGHQDTELEEEKTRERLRTEELAC